MLSGHCFWVPFTFAFDQNQIFSGENYKLKKYYFEYFLFLTLASVAKEPLGYSSK